MTGEKEGQKKTRCKKRKTITKAHVFNLEAPTVLVKVNSGREDGDDDRSVMSLDLVSAALGPPVAEVRAENAVKASPETVNFETAVVETRKGQT